MLAMSSCVQDLDGACAQSPTTPSPSGSMDAQQPPASPSAASAEAPPGATPPPSDSVFFARMPPTVPEEDLRALFERYGRVVHINVFRRWATAKTSKGCGTVQFASAEEAGAALAALNGLHTWSEFSNCEGPMVVEWKDDSRLSAADQDASHAGVRKCKRGSSSKGRQWGAKGASAAPGRDQQLPCWQQPWQQPLSAEQLSYVAMQNQRAATAAALSGARRGLPVPFGGIHPAVEALDVSACMLPPTPATSAGDVVLSPLGCGHHLGDPASWGSVIPVHMLPPMMSQAQPADCPSPLMMQGVPADAAGRYDFMPRAASASFACPTPGLEPWMSSAVSHHDSCSLSASAQISSVVPLTNALLAAQQQQQQQPSLMVFLEDGWPSDSCGGGLASATSCYEQAAGTPAAAASGSYSLFEPSRMMGSLSDASALVSAAAAAWPGLRPPVGYDSSASTSCGANIQQPCGGDAGLLAGGYVGSFSGSLPRLGSGLHGRHEAPGTRQPHQEQMQLPLTEGEATNLSRSTVHIAKVSGAKAGVMMDGAGSRLLLEGTSAQIQAAVNLVCLLL